MNANTVKEECSSDRKLLLVFFGSPHKNGTSAKLLTAFLEPFYGNAEIRIINAYEQNIAPCLGCNLCASEQACSQRDFDELDFLIRRADAIVVATPVYNLGFPAPLKAIIDRTQRYYAARFSLGIPKPIEKHKTAGLLVTCGSPGSEDADVLYRQLKRVFSVMNTALKGMAVWADTDAQGGHSTFANARKAAQDLALAILCEMCYHKM
ncbi:MAG: flavodoxin family protein [Clostridiales bacterium]|nr:flavodoxin family protein [Clostridiales bacterium]